MTIEPCDHTSVGIIIFRDGKLLLIDRKRPPLGLAAPAGHVDKHGDHADTEETQFEKAAQQETLEETGLTVTSLKLVAEGRKENPCRRPDGAWHYWRIYRAEVQGELRPSTEETRGHFECSIEEMIDLLAGNSMTTKYGEAGLEPVWKQWFNEINVLDHFPA